MYMNFSRAAKRAADKKKARDATALYRKRRRACGEVQIAIYVPVEIVAALRARAKATGKTLSAVVAAILAAST